MVDSSNCITVFKMIDFLQQIPASYAGALTALITATATLTGVCLTNKANHQRFATQLSQEQQTKQSELIRSKLEELYVLFKHWTTNIVALYITHTEIMAGNVNYENAHTIDKLGNSTIDFHRIEMLIDLYFPSLKPAYTKVIEVRGEANKILLAHREQCIAGNIYGKNFLQPFLKAQDAFDQEVKKFLNLLAEQSEQI